MHDRVHQAEGSLAQRSQGTGKGVSGKGVRAGRGHPQRGAAHEKPRAREKHGVCRLGAQEGKHDGGSVPPSQG